MAAMAQIFVLGQQIRLLRAFVLVVRHSFLGLVYSCLEVVVDLPFRFDQGVPGLAQEKGRMVGGHGHVFGKVPGLEKAVGGYEIPSQ